VQPEVANPLAAWEGATATIAAPRRPRVHVAPLPGERRKSSRSLGSVIGLCLFPLYVIVAMTLFVACIVVRDVAHFTIRVARVPFSQRRAFAQARPARAQPPSGASVMDPVNRIAKSEQSPESISA
jgi:predicted lipid-binding transport protein (Tim44 family)